MTTDKSAGVNPAISSYAILDGGMEYCVRLFWKLVFCAGKLSDALYVPPSVYYCQDWYSLTASNASGVPIFFSAFAVLSRTDLFWSCNAGIRAATASSDSISLMHIPHHYEPLNPDTAIVWLVLQPSAQEFHIHPSTYQPTPTKTDTATTDLWTMTFTFRI